MKKSFTLVELLIVIVMIGLLLNSILTSFKMSDKDLINAQSCLNVIYGDIRSSLLDAATSKGIYTGGANIEYPDMYSIIFDVQNDKVMYSFSGENSGYEITKTIVTTGSIDDKINGCYGVAYYVDLVATGVSSFDIDASLLMEGNLQDPGFVINNNADLFTGVVDANFCGHEQYQGTEFCRPLGRFYVDRRIKDVRFIKCYNWDKGGMECNQRSDDMNY